MSDFVQSSCATNGHLSTEGDTPAPPYPTSNIFNQWTESFLSVSIRGKTVLPTTTKMFHQENSWSKTSLVRHHFALRGALLNATIPRVQAAAFQMYSKLRFLHWRALPPPNTHAFLFQPLTFPCPRSAVLSHPECPLCSVKSHPARKHTSFLKPSPDSKLQWSVLPLLSPGCYFLYHTV